MDLPTTKGDIWNLALDKIGETDGIEDENEDRPAANVCRRQYDRILKLVLTERVWNWALRERVISNIDSQASTSAAAVGGETNVDIPFAYLDSSQLTITRIAAGGAETTLTPVTDYTITPATDGTNARATLVVALTSGQKTRVTVTTSRVGWDHVYNLPADLAKPVSLLYNGGRFELLPVSDRLEFAIKLNDKGDGKILCCNVSSSDFNALEYVALVTQPLAMPPHFIEALAWRLAVELAYALKKDARVANDAMQHYQVAIDEAFADSENTNQQTAEPLSPTEASRGD